MVKPTREAQDPDWRQPCSSCRPEPRPGSIEHWQGRPEPLQPVLLGHHWPDVRAPLPKGDEFTALRS